MKLFPFSSSFPKRLAALTHSSGNIHKVQMNHFLLLPNTGEIENEMIISEVRARAYLAVDIF